MWRLDYPVVVWSIHRLGGIVSLVALPPYSLSQTLNHFLTSCSNPQFTADELCHQLRTANITFMIVHSTVLDVSIQAARAYGLSTERIIVIDKSSDASKTNTDPLLPRRAVPDLITKGLSSPRCFEEQTFQRGEGKVKVALLAWSSGTTGKPKVSILSS